MNLKNAIICLLFATQLFGCLNLSTMKTELDKLDKNLREKRPEYYAQLQNPLTEAEISALETKYKVSLPEDLKALYLWKNGQKQTCYEALVNNSMFEPLGQVLNSAEDFTGMIGYDFLIENWWNEHWLPLFSNGGGAYICYDMEGVFTGDKGQLVEYWNADNDRNVIVPDLATFIKTMNNYYQETNSSDFDEFFDISDRLAPFKKEFIVDKPIPKNY